MPAALVNANLGFGTSDGSDTSSITVTLTEPVAAGDTIFLGVSWYNNVTITNVTGTGVSGWELAVQENNSGDANQRAALLKVDTAAGTADNAVLTVTFSGTAFARNVIAASFSGVDDFDVASAGGSATGQAWSAGSATNTNADALYVAFAWTSFREYTSTPDSPFSEAADANDAGTGQTLTLTYYVASSTASRTGSGNWATSDSSVTTACMAIYNAAAGGGTPPTNTVAPAITDDGTPQTGETVTCSDGTWTGDATITYAYQWKVDDGGGYDDIVGETTSSYLLDVADEGFDVKCTVTATNGAGSDSADSNVIVPAAAGTPGDDSYVRVAGAWVAVDRQVRVAGAWV